jgi:ATP-dependent RNA helicase DHX36
MQKIATPELNMAKRSGDLVRTIVELLETESEVAAEARKAQRDAEAASTVKETVNNPEV